MSRLGIDSLKRQADAGDTAAQYEYGIHLLSRGGPNELIDTARYFRLSADQGLAWGQYVLPIVCEKILAFQ
jgi:TPR repeat protein